MVRLDRRGADSDEEWLEDYETERPRDSLGRVPPCTFMPRSTRASEPSDRLSTWRGSSRPRWRNLWSASSLLAGRTC